MTKQEKIDIIKQHIANAIAEEQPKYKTIPNCFIFDRKEFFEDSKLRRLNNKFKLVRNNSIFEKTLGYTGYIEVPKYILYYTSGGFTNGKEIIILMKTKTLKKNFNEELYFKILSVFHEFRHIGQKENFDIKKTEKNITNFIDFRYMLEVCCRHYLPPIYALEHDDFYFEIDANLYGIQKSEEYCEKNGILPTKFQLNYKKKQYSKMLRYDFDKFITLHRLNPLIPIKLSKIPNYNIFFSKTGYFKRISDITKNPLFNSLDDKLKTELLSSKSFLSSINYKLNDMEINYLLDIIDKKITELINNYNKNKELYNNNVFNYNVFIKNSDSLLSQIEFLLNYKLQYSKTKYYKSGEFLTFQQQIRSIRAVYKSNNDALTVDEYNRMIQQLKTIISTCNDFFVDNNNMQNIHNFLSIVKILRQAILANIDINNMAIDAYYEQITTENKSNNGNGGTNRVKKRSKGNISYQLIFFVNVILSIIITIGYLFIIYK